MRYLALFVHSFRRTWKPHEEIGKRAPYVDLVFGPQTLHRLPEMMAKRSEQSGPGGTIVVDVPVHREMCLIDQL